MKLLLAKIYRWFSGWSFEGQVPPTRKFIILAAPHTSNWDLPAMLCLAWTLGLRLRWMGKHTLFRWPLGPLMRWMGGLPIDRRAAHGVVQEVVAAFQNQDELELVIPPEGTRGRAEYWKSGFYHIALAAHVPIVLGRLDWATHIGSLSEPFYPTGDVRADMDFIRAHYAGVTALHPDRFGPIRLKEEDRPAT